MVLDQVWIWYLATVSVAVGVFGWDAPEGNVVAYLAIHIALLGCAVAVRRATASRSAGTRRFARAAFAIVAMPIVFSALGLVLPGVHPEPWEWTWIAWDRSVCGVDPSVAVSGWLSPACVEILQWVYASFYFLPIVTVALLGITRGAHAFDRALLSVVFCFLVSYLGYFLWPTLPPYRFLPYDAPLVGIWLAEPIRVAIDASELNRWDCYPSGHTMLSLVCLLVAWPCRVLFAGLVPVVALLVFSTVALRYHYVSDVIAGVLFVLPALGCATWMRSLGGAAEQPE